jgi:hypothetical protein
MRGEGPEKNFPTNTLRSPGRKKKEKKRKNKKKTKEVNDKLKQGGLTLFL